MSHIGKSKIDEVPCRSCTSFAEYMKTSKKRYLSDLTKSEGSTTNISTDAFLPRDDCPADKSLLGRSTWIFLHTMAARYPDKPSTTEQKEMNSFFRAFAKFYPCEYCAQDFQEEIKKHPPQLKSQEDLSQWLCGIHNIVNVKIGKKEFDCSTVNERWRDGWLDGSCG